MNQKVETLHEIYTEVMGAVEKAHETDDWELMAALLEVASDLAWRMKARIEEEVEVK